MAQTFSGNIKFALAGTFSNDSDLSTLTQAFNYSKNYNVTNGTGADQANMIWADSSSIGASSDTSLDLYGGLTNAFGSPINFTSIKGIVIVASSSNTNDVVVGADGSAAFIGWFGSDADTLAIKPGGMFALINPGANGYGVTATTGDKLKLANSSSGSGVDYDIIILGEV